MAKDIDLAPFFALMADTRVLKVFHAARQDVEIMINLADAVPTPIFDTQIAAMVCGFGDQVGYEAIVRKLVGAQIDKSSQFTDWSRRPLTHKQMAYALSDVTHLRTVYEKLTAQIERESRSDWLEGELEDPRQSRLLPRRPRAVLAAHQGPHPEQEAAGRTHGRGRVARAAGAGEGRAAWPRVLKDDAVAEIAIQVPQTRDALLQLAPPAARISRFGDRQRHSGSGRGRGWRAIPPPFPAPKGRGEEMSSSQEAAAEILKLALKIVSEREGIAPKLIASSADIDAIADMDDNADVPRCKAGGATCSAAWRWT